MIRFVIHDKILIFTTEFFVIMSLFTAMQNIKEYISMNWSVDLWHLNNVLKEIC